jgi:uncharacterized repeat protein (TIGR01451 family)
MAMHFVLLVGVLGLVLVSVANGVQTTDAARVNKGSVPHQNADDRGIVDGDTSNVKTPVSGLRSLAADETGLILELRTPDFEVASQTTTYGVCDQISVSGYASMGKNGWPQLPVRGVTIGVPPGAAVNVTVLESESVPMDSFNDLCPVPQPVIERSVSGAVRYVGQSLEPDKTAYALDSFYPSVLAEVVSTGYIRSQRVAQLQLYPFQVNPLTGQLRHIRRLRVRVNFGSDIGLLASTDPLVEEDLFEETLRHTLLNYEQARAWRQQAEGEVLSLRATEQGESYKVMVDQDGVYEVSYSDLEAAGVDVHTLDPRTFQLHNRGQEVAVHVSGEGDGTFDPGDHLLFYGQKVNTRYTDVNVYWLTYGAGSGWRMGSREGAAGGTGGSPDSFETTFHLEEDVNYVADVPEGDEGDHWFADSVFAYSGPDAEVFTFTLRNIATTPYSVTMRGMLFGWSHFGPSADHHTRVYLNGHLVDDAVWDGWRDYHFEHTVPDSHLIEGTNVISVECPFDLAPEVQYDIVYPNWFEIDYRQTHRAEDDRLSFNETDVGDWEYHIRGFTTSTLQVFDITSPTNPIRILNPSIDPVSDTFSLRFEDSITNTHRYLALASEQRLVPLRIERDPPSDLRAPTSGADYIIIAHRDFITDVIPLVEHRSAQGLLVAVVDVQDVYDEFNAGIFNPAAIQDFLRYAYANWPASPPSYVLLVGDGNYDFKDNFGRQEPNYVPPYLADVDPWMGETAADNRYVCVSGEDIMPDMHLGRLPVKTSAEASAMVSKILGYEQNPAPDDWNQKVLFVADNEDSAGDFAAFSDSVADQYLPVPYQAQKAYYKVTHSTPVSVTNTITRAINEGRLVVNYIGHSSPSFWAWEYLLRKDDLDSLTNYHALPLVVPMTCLEGYYIHPSSSAYDNSSFSEEFVRAEGRGAIASWSPTGLGVASGHDFLNKGLFEAIFSDDVIELGPATTQAKYYLYSRTAGYRELLDTYLLFGDPATRLNVLKTDLALTQTVATPDRPVQPGDAVTVTLAYTNAGPATAHHVVLTDTLAAALISPTVVASGAPITLRVGSRLAWDVADLAAGQGGVVTLTAQISPTFTGTFTHTARIATTAVETDTANNVTPPVRIGVNVPDLRLGKRGPAQVYPHDRLTYTLTYTNAGGAPAHGVVLTDVLPSQVFSPTVTSSGAVITPRAGTRLVWDVADLAPGAGGTLTVTAHLTPTATGVFTNTARIATAAPELLIADNHAHVTTAVVWHTLYLPLVTKHTD